MFVPASFALVFAVMWVLGGALLGVPLGWVSARLIGLSRSRAWPDAAMGAATAILAMSALIAAVGRGTRVVDGRTPGWRGILRDHLALWAIGLVWLAVPGRQLVVARMTRRPQDGSLPSASASDTRQA
jgi:hypothetical protein